MLMTETLIKFRFEGLKKFSIFLINFIHNLKSFHFFLNKKRRYWQDTVIINKLNFISQRDFSIENICEVLDL